MTTAELLAVLERRGLSLAVAESLTGGALAAEIVSVPGASAVFRGGVVTYATESKHSVLGVPAQLLAAHGPVHADVAAAMAVGVQELFAFDGGPVDVGLSTTGVAGPGPQDGHPAGTVFLGVAIGSDVRTVALQLHGDRGAIRLAVVSESLRHLEQRLAEV